MPDFITVEMIDDLATGAAFLGTGGGGDPYIGALLCRAALEEFGPVRLMEPDNISDEAAVYTIAGMGAPTILVEKLMSLEDADIAVRALEHHLGKPASAIIAAEIGGINSMLPIAYAAMRGLPLIDGDGMGRAFPSLQMTSFNLGGVACAPMTMADEWGDHVIIQASTAQRAEDLSRPLVAALGASAMISCYPMTGREVRSSAVFGTMHAAYAVGQAIRDHSSLDKPTDGLIKLLNDLPLYGGARCLFEGKITALERDTTRGWVFGQCTIAQLQGDEVAVVSFQNENLSVLVDGQLRAVVPDLISIVDSETCLPITTEGLRYGQRVCVIGCHAPRVLQTEQALKVMGPSAFGLPHIYEPIKQQ
jgi:uncharacterized protein